MEKEDLLAMISPLLGIERYWSWGCKTAALATVPFALPGNLKTNRLIERQSLLHYPNQMKLSQNNFN